MASYEENTALLEWGETPHKLTSFIKAGKINHKHIIARGWVDTLIRFKYYESLKWLVLEFGLKPDSKSIATYFRRICETSDASGLNIFTEMFGIKSYCDLVDVEQCLDVAFKREQIDLFHELMIKLNIKPGSYEISIQFRRYCGYYLNLAQLMYTIFGRQLARQYDLLNFVCHGGRIDNVKWVHSIYEYDQYALSQALESLFENCSISQFDIIKWLVDTGATVDKSVMLKITDPQIADWIFHKFQPNLIIPPSECLPKLYYSIDNCNFGMALWYLNNICKDSELILNTTWDINDIILTAISDDDFEFADVFISRFALSPCVETILEGLAKLYYYFGKAHRWIIDRFNLDLEVARQWAIDKFDTNLYLGPIDSFEPKIR